MLYSQETKRSILREVVEEGRTPSELAKRNGAPSASTIRRWVSEKRQHDAEGAVGAYPVLLEHAVRFWGAEEENARRLSNRIKLEFTLIAGFFGLGLTRFIDRTTVHTARLWILCSMIYLGLAGLQLLARFQPSSRLWFQAVQVLGVPFLVASTDAFANGHAVSADITIVLGLILIVICVADRSSRWMLSPRDEAAVVVAGQPPSRHASVSLNLDPSIWVNLPIPEDNSKDAAVAAAFFSTQRGAFRLHVMNQEEQLRVDAGQQFLLLGLGSILGAILAVLLAT